MRQPPVGTITMLFTDIEGSTRLLRGLGDRYVELLADHHLLMREAIAAHEGYEVDNEGDAFFVTFTRARDALAAAAEMQRALASHAWAERAEVRVRMGLHTGEPLVAGEKYVGLAVHHAARVMSAGHGGQVLVSEATRQLLGEQLPPGLVLRSLGEHRLKDLSGPQVLYQLEIDGMARDFPPLKTLGARPNNLPVQINRLVGRDRELEEILAHARDGTRLLTLVGPGGTGKTRLALQAAAELAEDFEDGVFFVSLAPLSDASLVLPTVAQTLGKSDESRESLLEDLAGSSLFVVLDNLEQLMGAASDVRALAGASAGIRLVATSREPLRVSGEHVYEVPPLPTPDERESSLEHALGNDAVVLFCERAVAAKRSFVLTEANAGHVADICRKLDGLPLALELAAARVRVLSPEAISTRLERSLGLLTSGARDADERQQTLRATIQWSYELLEPAEQVLLARLSVFAGGCRLDAAEAVCDPRGELGIEVFDGLASLVDKSLVRQRDDFDAEPRFWLLHVIREFAREEAEKRGMSAELQGLHAAYYLTLAEEFAVGRRTSQEAFWMARIRADYGNLRAVLASGRLDPGDRVRLSSALGYHWYTTCELDARRWLPADRGEASASGVETSVAAEALYWAAAMELLAREPDLANAKRLNDDALVLFEAAGDERGAIRTYWNANDVAHLAGAVDEAAELIDAGVARARRLGDVSTLAGALMNQADNYLRLGDAANAERAAREAAALLREHGRVDTSDYGSALHNLALALLEQKRVIDAAATLREAVPVLLTTGEMNFSLYALIATAAASLQAGRAEPAASLLGAVDSFREQHAVALGIIEQRLFDEALERVRADRALEIASATGRSWTVEQALDFATELAREIAEAPAS